jgi:MGT family glycosyltransferase
VLRGHDVRFYTGAAFRLAVEGVGAKFVPWDAAPDFDETRLSETFPRIRQRAGLAQVFTNLQELFIATAPGLVADLLAEWQREPWDVLVGEESSVGPGFAAERIGCRWATVAVLPLGLPSGRGVPTGMGLEPGRGPLGRGRDAVFRAVAGPAMRPLNRRMAQVRRVIGLETSPLSFREAVFSPDLILATGVPQLDFDRTDRPSHVHWVGVLAARAAAHGPHPDWWEELGSRRTIVVTQGTYDLNHERLLRPALTALADVDALVIGLTGTPGLDRVAFEVPPNVRIAGFVPFVELLPRTDLLITNGGWGGVLAALSHGIPTIVAGADLDKPEIAARLSASGAGINLRTGRPSSSAVSRAVGDVFANSTYQQKADEIAAALREAGGPNRAVDLLETYASSL